MIPSWIEILGFLSGAACVWLLVRESLWNWPVGIVNNLLFLVLFWRTGLYADSGLQLVFVALSIYGWWNWLHGATGGDRLPVGRTPPGAAVGVAVATLVAAVLLAWLLDSWTPSTVPWGDATMTALSLAAIYLQARKWIETWYVWIAADLLSIGLYLAKGLWLTAVLYALFLGLCLVGLRDWRRRLARAPGPAPAAVARAAESVVG